MKTTKRTINCTRTALQLTFSAMTLVFTVALFGCSEEDEAEGTERISTQTNALSTSDRKAASDRKNMRHGKHGHRGSKHGNPAGMFFRTALDQTSLTPEQRQTIEALTSKKKHDGRGRKGNRKAAKTEFRAAMVDALRSGSVDVDMMKKHREERAAKQKARAAARAEALNTLYATLNADQRRAVVEDIKQRLDRKSDTFKGKRHSDKQGKGFGKGRRGKRHGDAHTHAKHDVPNRPAGQKGFHGKRGRHGHKADRIFGLVRGIVLTEEQHNQIVMLKEKQRTGRPSETERKEKREAMKQCHASVLDSFAGEHFDAAAATCGKAPAEQKLAQMDRRIERFSKLLGILTEEQRFQLADRLENPTRPRNKTRTI